MSKKKKKLTIDEWIRRHDAVMQERPVARKGTITIKVESIDAISITTDAVYSTKISISEAEEMMHLLADLFGYEAISKVELDCG